MHSASIARETGFSRAVKLTLWLVVILWLMTAVAAAVKAADQFMIPSDPRRPCPGGSPA